MSRNEIRVRRTISPGQIARHRNYSKLMNRHSRYLKMKRSVIALVYVLILVLMIMLYMLVRRIEYDRKLHPEKYKKTAGIEPPAVRGNEIRYTLTVLSAVTDNR